MQSKQATLEQTAGPPGKAEPPGVRQQVLDATALLLRRKGYEATTTRAIAEHVGIKGGSIYHHFPSKDAIIAEVVNIGVRVVYDAVAQAIAALPATATPRQRIEAAIKAHLLSSLEHSDYTSASIRAFAFLPSEIRTACRAERYRYEDLWRSLVSELYKAKLIDPKISKDSLRLLLLGALNWAGEWYRPDRMDIDKIARDFAASVVHSV
jgi:AcrR family transcriptional regulator